ncbi:type IX secretion system membrane protein PorP/SprF [Algoriphagus sp. NG3]|uniref:PorP/SprF family type IX secretion system membrane protein n=1 Tax=Algoriphagus sp. NG3 TaxID=3097546 RepID=UPI002A7FB056|nr:type IX secretion system membrane protein PorP/SprF [Algoriphagus sp. NG3]WPR77763.1 type IX secretion system membrane protein PorP/SprF [Algoriphagus sp. NG3]
MNVNNKLVVLIFMAALSVTGKVSGQQLPQFSQYMFNGLHINPGYAGYKQEGYIQSTYRSQWTGFPGAPKTLSVTADFSANEGTMGFGFAFMNDELGPARTTGGLLTYSYRIQTGKESFLGLGISAGASEYAIDRSKLNPNEWEDEVLMGGIVNLYTPNMNAGIFFNTSNFYAGFSAFNMIGKRKLKQEDIALAYHDFHYYLTAGLLLPLSDNVQVKPSFLIKEVKGAPTNYDLNAMFLFYDRLWLGGSYRSNVKWGKDNLDSGLTNRNAVAMLVEIFATNNLRIGYAYDHNLNVLSDLRNNSHEFSLGYYLSARNAKMKNQRWF